MAKTTGNSPKFFKINERIMRIKQTKVSIQTTENYIDLLSGSHETLRVVFWFNNSQWPITFPPAGKHFDKLKRPFTNSKESEKNQ